MGGGSLEGDVAGKGGNNVDKQAGAAVWTAMKGEKFPLPLETHC